MPAWPGGIEILLAEGSGKDQAVENAAGGGVEGEVLVADGNRAWNVEPIGAQPDGNGIGLALQTPAGVVGGP